MAVERIPGQVPSLAGAVAAAGLVFTSGLVAPTVLAGRETAFADQARQVLDELAATLERAGSGLDQVLRVEAFLASSADFPAWNEAFARVWPVAPPARTTLLGGFLLPAALIEVQAVAARRGTDPDMDVAST
jgi:2-iminobutanoate/2-iminopropanoate deaminase